MNKEGRKKIAEALEHLESAQSILEGMGEEEQEKFDNLTEGLQQGERGQQFEANAQALNEAFEAVGTAIDQLGEVQ